MEHNPDYITPKMEAFIKRTIAIWTLCKECDYGIWAGYNLPTKKEIERGAYWLMDLRCKAMDGVICYDLLYPIQNNGRCPKGYKINDNGELI